MASISSGGDATVAVGSDAISIFSAISLMLDDLVVELLFQPPRRRFLPEPSRSRCCRTMVDRGLAFQ